ncbi:1102_t:CDS:2 [Rhizophagus irregularis]|nr:1102_t:CDS:2 [Rhizophagus irregularis]
MQSSSILEFPHSTSKITSKKNLETQKGTFMKQQNPDKNDNDTTPTNDLTSENNAPSSGVTTNFFYKITEIVAYTSASISDTYNTFMAGGTPEPEHSTRKRSYSNGYHDDVMQINADDSDGAYYNDEISEVNDDEEEPPPPYDNSWVMPKSNSGENSMTNAPMSSSPKRIETSNVESKPTSTPEDTNSTTMSQTIPRRRQIRVRRPRRLLRRKSTEVSTPRGGSGGRRKNAVEYDCYTDGNYSSLEYFDYGGYGTYSGHGSGFTSPSGYESPDTYASHGHYNSPSQFGSPATSYHQTPQGGFNYSTLGYKFNENEFNSIPNQYYGQPSSNGFVEPAIPKGFGAGPISGGFGAKFGRYGSNNNNGGFGNYGHHFGSNAGGFGSNVFGSNGGYRANGMYNNREFLY